MTRIKLDQSKRKTLIALATPSIFHGIVESLFNDKTRKLWRIDSLNGQKYLLIVSEKEPDISDQINQIAEDIPEYKTKDYSKLLNQIEPGTCWQFRLCSNPTYSAAAGKNERGRRCAHTTRKHQLEWLKCQSQKCGFELLRDNYDVTHSQWFRFSKGSPKRQINMLQVTFEGLLRVENKELFVDNLINGIGREKAYGCGLLTVTNNVK